MGRWRMWCGIIRPVSGKVIYEANLTAHVGTILKYPHRLRWFPLLSGLSQLYFLPNGAQMAFWTPFLLFGPKWKPLSQRHVMIFSRKWELLYPEAFKLVPTCSSIKIVHHQLTFSHRQNKTFLNTKILHWLNWLKKYIW